MIVLGVSSLRGSNTKPFESEGHPFTVDAPKALSYASPNTPSGDAP